MHVACAYAPPVDYLIATLKFRQRFWPAPILARLLWDTLAARRAPLPEGLVPVPQHPWARARRGFNQAELLAAHLARRARRPLLSGQCRKVRSTPPQHALDRRARASSLRGAFQVAEPFPASSVALVDDVVTTGHTVAELTRCLQAAGVKDIQVWAVARTVLPLMARA